MYMCIHKHTIHTHAFELELNFYMHLSIQHPPDLHGPQRTRQESRGEWPPSYARPQETHSPRLSGTRKAKKSATRDLRYGAEKVKKKVHILSVYL